MSERKEALMRIVVLIVSGIILGLWKFLVQVAVIINWIIVIFTDKRNKDIADFCNLWNCQAYSFLAYVTFVTNKRPFPFGKLVKQDDLGSLK